MKHVLPALAQQLLGGPAGELDEVAVGVGPARPLRVVLPDEGRYSVSERAEAFFARAQRLLAFRDVAHGGQEPVYLRVLEQARERHHHPPPRTIPVPDAVFDL